MFILTYILWVYWSKVYKEHCPFKTSTSMWTIKYIFNYIIQEYARIRCSKLSNALAKAWDTSYDNKYQTPMLNISKQNIGNICFSVLVGISVLVSISVLVGYIYIQFVTVPFCLLLRFRSSSSLWDLIINVNFAS